jgi:hypothetical protein
MSRQPQEKSALASRHINQQPQKQRTQRSGLALHAMMGFSLTDMTSLFFRILGTVLLRLMSYSIGIQTSKQGVPRNRHQLLETPSARNSGCPTPDLCHRFQLRTRTSHFQAQKND